MKPDISIITVSLNSGQLLDGTIQSILSQKSPAIEYIIVDGISTDNTPSILHKYRIDIDIVLTEKDRGIYDAMNKGIALASGDYLLFLNAGDTLCEGAIKTIKNELAKRRLDVYYYRYFNVVKARNKWLKFVGPRCFDLSQEMPTSHNAMIISRTAFNLYGYYDSSHNLAADYEWLCRNKDVLNTAYFEDFIMCALLGGVSETENLSVLKEKTLIAKKYFGKVSMAWHLVRLTKIFPLTLLKRVLICLGIFDYYLLAKHKVMSRE